MEAELVVFHQETEVFYKAVNTRVVHTESAVFNAVMVRLRSFLTAVPPGKRKAAMEHVLMLQGGWSEETHSGNKKDKFRHLYASVTTLHRV